jgi:flavin reductase (DIM6/NTAB) family NADH-FMN oxidoreductase RutF
MSEARRSVSDRSELRRTLGTFATGVTVVTTLDQAGCPRGMTANSFTSVSLDPPLVLVCVAKAAPICIAFRAAEGFAVNILSEGQRELSQRFASRMPDRFAGLSWHQGASGAPILDGSLAFLDCRAREQIEAGDHVILIGEVEEFGRTAQSPLLFSQGAYLSVNLHRQRRDPAGCQAGEARTPAMAAAS